MHARTHLDGLGVVERDGVHAGEDHVLSHLNAHAAQTHDKHVQVRQLEHRLQPKSPNLPAVEILFG
jgi:hypothetical protein